jgi:hypothetical protein
VVYPHAALLQSAAPGWRTRPVDVGDAGRVGVHTYDGSGRLVDRATLTGPTVRVRVAPGGFTVLRW